MQRRDAIVIGAGLNGLVAAAYLARAGLTVLVLERNARPGGIDAMREFAPGFHAPQFRLRPSSLPRHIIADLDLAAYGLRQFRVDAGISLLENGESIAHYANPAVLKRELSRFSPRDADACLRFNRHMRLAALGLAPHLKKLLPGLTSFSFANLRRQLAFASSIADHSVVELFEQVRLWSASCDELLGDYFDSPQIRAHYAASTLPGATWGPRSATSGYHLLAPFLNDPEVAPGGDPRISCLVSGPGGAARALQEVIEAHGGQIRYEAEVTDVLLKGGQAGGVVLADGEELLADVVLSDLDAKHSFLSLFKWKDLPDGLAERVAHLRMKGVTAKINLALDQAPVFSSVPKDCPALLGGVRIVGSLDRMEHAYDDWRGGVIPDAPLLFVDVPSWRDPSLAPSGQHVMSVLVQYVPLQPLDGTWDDERRESLGQSVLNLLELHCPGLKNHLFAQDMWLSTDMETEAGAAFGDLSCGEAMLDQMFFSRPLPGMENKTPIKNFYLCSAAAHPGPFVTGQSGANAAQHLLTRKRRGGQ